jgi:hypothetical protein
LHTLQLSESLVVELLLVVAEAAAVEAVPTTLIRMMMS